MTGLRPSVLTKKDITKKIGVDLSTISVLTAYFNRLPAIENLEPQSFNLCGSFLCCEIEYHKSYIVFNQKVS